MSNFESPIEFNLNKKINNCEIVYSNVMEVTQGGPQIGNIAINGKSIEDYRFGGPVLYKNLVLFIPVFIRKTFKTGFRLAKIDIHNLDMQFIGKMRNLIFLSHIEDNIICFFTDINKTEIEYYKV